MLTSIIKYFIFYNTINISFDPASQNKMNEETDNHKGYDQLADETPVNIDAEETSSPAKIEPDNDE